MMLTPPKQITFFIAIALGVLGLIGAFGVAILAPYAFWFAFLAFALLVVALLVKGLWIFPRLANRRTPRARGVLLTVLCRGSLEGSV